MPYKIVTLSDGQPCKVRQLGLYELNSKGRDLLGPYSYSLLLATGQVVEDTYDLRALDEIPQPPDVPRENIQQGSPEWYQLEEYETYLCAVAHEKKRIESYHGYVDDIIGYILMSCVSPENHSRIVTPEDWELVYQAALVPELTMEVIVQTLDDCFRGFIQWSANNGRAFRHLRWQRQHGRTQTMGT